MISHFQTYIAAVLCFASTTLFTNTKHICPAGISYVPNDHVKKALDGRKIVPDRPGARRLGHGRPDGAGRSSRFAQEHRVRPSPDAR